MSAQNGIENWEASLEKEIEVLRLASAEGNVTFLSVYQEKTAEMALLDASSLYQGLAAMDVSSMYQSTVVHQQMKEKSEIAVKETEASCDVLHGSLNAFREKNADASESDWESFLDSEVEKHKAESNKRWDDLKAFGKMKIKELPEKDRPAAARTYGAGLSVVGALLGKVTGWLKEGLQRITEFFRHAWEKIQEFAGKAAEWCSNAWTSVTTIFSGVFSLAAMAGNGKYGQFHAVSDTASYPYSGATVEDARQLLDFLSRIVQGRNFKPTPPALNLKPMPSASNLKAVV